MIRVLLRLILWLLIRVLLRLILGLRIVCLRGNAGNLHEFFVVLFSGLFHDNEPVDDRHKTENAKGEQLQHAETNVADIETVNADTAEQQREDQRGGGVLIVRAGKNHHLRIIHAFQLLGDDRDLHRFEIALILYHKHLDFFLRHKNTS